MLIWFHERMLKILRCSKVYILKTFLNLIKSIHGPPFTRDENYSPTRKPKITRVSTKEYVFLGLFTR